VSGARRERCGSSSRTNYDAEYRYDGPPVGACRTGPGNRVVYAGSARQAMDAGLPGFGWFAMPGAPGRGPMALVSSLGPRIGRPTAAPPADGAARPGAGLIGKGESTAHAAGMRPRSTGARPRRALAGSTVPGGCPWARAAACQPVWPTWSLAAAGPGRGRRWSEAAGPGRGGDRGGVTPTEQGYPGPGGPHLSATPPSNGAGNRGGRRDILAGASSPRAGNGPRAVTAQGRESRCHGGRR